MAKLYPPYIEGSLPAAYLDEEGWHLKIPFSMNRAVSNAQVAAISMRISTLSSRQVIEQSFAFTPGMYELNRTVSATDDINIGQFYKVQLAYVSAADGITGYYSTVGIIKCIAKPTITINKLNRNSTNYFTGSFTGRYTLEEDNVDLSERVYSYEFNIYDSEGHLYITSGVQIHDNNSDSNVYICEDTWTPEKFGNEESHSYYTIQYKITTLNGYIGYSPKYRLQMFSMFKMDPSMVIYPLPDYDNGCVEVVLIGMPDDTLIHEQKYTGSYVISRRVVSDYADESWVPIHKFRLTRQEPSTYVFRDFTVEQGVTYKYSIQQINSYGMFTDRVVSPPVYADFEDMFLFDGRRALRIRFNPKVASFKTTLQESKTDTIGSKYPYFFRNGNVSYKEFPISGLLSYFIDDNELFIRDAELGLEEEQSPREESIVWSCLKSWANPDDIHEDDHKIDGIDYSKGNIDYRHLLSQEEEENLQFLLSDRVQQILPDWLERRRAAAERRVRTRNFTGYNLFAERTFKLHVLDWLNDGKLKLFKSPTEGNYVVRLMNNSLTPQDPLGRMLHTFSSTAYEAANNNMSSLVSAGIVDLDDSNIAPVPEYHWQTIWMYPEYEAEGYWVNNDGYIMIERNQIITFEVHDFIPGDSIEIHRKGDEDDVWERIVIGPTGNYIMQHEIKPLDKIRIEYPDGYALEPVRHGWIDICCLEDTSSPFDLIENINVDSIINVQIPGDGSNVLSHEEFRDTGIEYNWEKLKISQRPLVPVYHSEEGWYGAPSNPEATDKKSALYLYPTFLDLVDDCGATWGIYEIRDAANPGQIQEYRVWNEKAEADENWDKFVSISPDGFIYDTRFAINGVAGKVDDKEQYVEYHNIGTINRLWLGIGVLAEGVISTYSITYANEEERNNAIQEE